MPVEVKIVILVVASAGLALLTGRSLRSFRSHGLYRFLSFVTVSVLVLLNLEHWFNEPFTLRQIVSWLLLLASIVMITYGVISLRRGRPGSGRNYRWVPYPYCGGGGGFAETPIIRLFRAIQNHSSRSAMRRGARLLA